MRSLTTKLKSQINSQNIDDVFLWLLKVEHDSLDDPIYLVNNNENIISNGITHTAFGFNITLAPDDDGEQPIGKLELSNVGRDFVDEIRSIVTPLKFSLKLVLASDPDTVEIEIPRLLGRSLSYNENLISFTLSYDDILSVLVPSHSYNPIEFGGLF